MSFSQLCPSVVVFLDVSQGSRYGDSNNLRGSETFASRFFTGSFDLCRGSVLEAIAGRAGVGRWQASHLAIS